MANEVVVPFPRSRSKPRANLGPSLGPSFDGPWQTVPRSERTRFWARLSTAREIVRGVVETLSYMREARVRPPLPPALPPGRPPK